MRAPKRANPRRPAPADRTGAAVHPVLLGALVLVVGAIAVWVLAPALLAPESGEKEDQEAAAPAEPLELDRHPVGGGTHPAPAEDELTGVDRVWIEANNRAHRLLQEEDLEGAVELFEECHEAVPEEIVFRRNLAEALVRLARAREEEGRLWDAIPDLERAIELAPEREDVDALRERLARWKKEWEIAQSHTTELSLYFEVSYDLARDDILKNSQEAIGFLDDAYVEMTEWFLADPVLHEGRPKFRVMFYTREEFDDLTGLGAWAGGVYDGSIRISVQHLSAEAAQWGRVLRHELVHAFVKEVGGDSVPGWLNEGLAQYLDASIHLNPRRAESIRQARERLRGVALYPLDALAGSLATWTDTQAISSAYAESLAVVDFIARQYGAEALREMLAGAKGDEGVEAAFRRWTGGVGLDEVVEFLRQELERE